MTTSAPRWATTGCAPPWTTPSSSASGAASCSTADRTLDLRTRAAGALLLAGPDAVLVGSTAAVLHGCTAVGGHPVHVRVPYLRRVRSRDGLVVHQGPVAEADVEVLDGLRVLRPEPLLADVLRTESRRGALACADELLRGLPEPDRPAFRAAGRARHRRARRPTLGAPRAVPARPGHRPAGNPGTERAAADHGRRRHPGSGQSAPGDRCARSCAPAGFRLAGTADRDRVRSGRRLARPRSGSRSTPAPARLAAAARATPWTCHEPTTLLDRLKEAFARRQLAA